MVWPEKSSKINIIKNVWDVMDRLVYSGHRVCNNLYDLK